MPGTKIVILRMREVIYTAIFVGLGILLLIILFFMFWPGKDEKTGQRAETGSEVQYQAGVYTKEIKIGEATVDLQVALDQDHVKSVKIVPLDESVTTMYPLMEPAVNTISEQLAAGTSVEEIELSEESQYTQEIIMKEVKSILNEETIQKD